jgi:hypothetical protein
VTRADRRDAAAFPRLKGVSERRARRRLGLCRSGLRYRPREGRDEALRHRLLGSARRHPRYGDRRARAMLRPEGWDDNPKRVHRVWKEPGLAVPRPRRRHRRGGGHDPVPVLAVHPGHIKGPGRVDRQASVALAARYDRDVSEDPRPREGHDDVAVLVMGVCAFATRPP